MENSGRIFATNSEQFEKCLKQNMLEMAPLGERVIDNGIVLPLKCNANYPTELNYYSGGVCDSKGAFVAGSSIRQKRFSCSSTYEIPTEEVQNSDETVVFGGVFFCHFGLTLVQGLARFWWIVNNIDTTNKLVFLTEPSKNDIAQKHCEGFMKTLGISKKRYAVITKPSSFNKIIIPDEVSELVTDKVNIRFRECYDKMREIVLAKYGKADCKKLYLSRKKYIKGNGMCDGVNEEYYEHFFRKRGYKIVYPEKLSISKQIQYIASAEEIVSTYGTVAHMASLFSNDNTKQLMLLRCDYVDDWFPVQAAILQLFPKDWYIVEASLNLFPTIHDDGSFIYCPTQYFKQFLDSQSCEYEIKELEVSLSNEQIKQYLLRWLSVYVKPERYKLIAKTEMFPILNSLYYSLTGKDLEPENYKEGNDEAQI